MVFKNLCVFMLRTKVASALIGLKLGCGRQEGPPITVGWFMVVYDRQRSWQDLFINKDNYQSLISS